LPAPTRAKTHAVAPPRLIAWEVTRQCPLACRHCRASAEKSAYEGELSTDECFRVLDNIAAFARPTIILTGGEPLLRPDIFDLAAHARGLGLPVVLATCGKPLTPDVAARLKESGVHAISISLDGASAASHDAFRGETGAFDAALRALAAAKQAGLAFQVNTTVTRLNRAELPAIRDLAIRLGAHVFNPFLLVPTGRGKELAEMELSAQEYEETLRWLAEQEDRPDIRIRVTCAPHYQRIVLERRRSLKRAGSAAPPADADAPGGPPAGAEPPAAQGCLGGKAFAFISHRGQVQICGFLDVECGDLRRDGLDFRRIWETSEVLGRMRRVDEYRGRCGRCEYRGVCGGCRARAYALTGDYLAEEPFCVHEPRAPRGRRGTAAEARLDATDKKILTEVQAGLPVAARPFDLLAERIGVPANEVLGRLAHLQSKGLIRRLGPVFDSQRLGYVSTLVAGRVPPERLAEVARLAAALPGVTHCYERRHPWNLWFTLTSRSAREIEDVLADLRKKTGIAELYSLPALAIYKIRVHFDLTGESAAPEAAAPGPPGPAIVLGEPEKELVRLLQDGLPLEREPFAGVAQRLRWPAARVIGQIREWLAAGVIRRFGAVVRHQTLGYAANAMSVFRVPEERVDEAGRRLAGFAAISHCYRRPTLPEFPYNLFAMVHGRTEDEIRALVDGAAKDLGLPDPAVLFSAAEFKKTSMRYFLEGDRP
jgi:heme b synthase